jgi:hypothetical protein
VPSPITGQQESEYLFVDLQNSTFTPLPPFAPNTVKFNANLIRAGVDYKF